MMMRSMYAKVLLWCIFVLMLTLVAFAYISITIGHRNFGKGGPFERWNNFELSEAREAYETGGVAKLDLYLHKLDKSFKVDHRLVNSSGKDIVTGADESSLLQSGRRVLATDGRFTLVATAVNQMEPWSFLPYYFLVLAIVAMLCWAFAVTLASPLRGLAGTVERFGRGDLSARVNSRRRDEIGNLANSFDDMANRIQTLLTAERRLLQDISHELRSPLARLSFAAELTKTAEDRGAAAARLRKEIDRLADLVGALIQVTRVEGDPSSGDVADFALSEFLEEVVSDCDVEAAPRGCRVELTSSAAVTYRGDRELLRRAVENVLRNAIRYAPQGTPVEVKLSNGGGAASISVRDYGPGVPEELLPRIFHPFFRVDDSRDSTTGGVGLGLAIAHRAVTVHHGRVSAKNAGPGLLVSIELPLEAPR